VNPVVVAAKGKGAMNAARRAGAIGTHYGVTPRRMEDRLEVVRRITEPFGAATLPITAAALGRNPGVVKRLSDHGIEFAVHGYYHVDHAGLDAMVQDRHLAKARRLFEDHGIPAVGFRAPYLRWNDGTVHALVENGFLYDSSQAMHWPIDPALETDGYRRGLSFYGSLSATEYPVVPRIDDGVVRIPCCLPDDESVVDRLDLPTPDAIASLWLDIWGRTHERGELFTMQVHPERIEPCGPGISAVLDAASEARQRVWVARMSEIAGWWRARTEAVVEVGNRGPGRYLVRCSGPPGLTVLVRGLNGVPSRPWADGYERARSLDLEVESERRPFIGVDPAAPRRMVEFLREQGFIVESAASPDTHTIYVRRGSFRREDELPLLEQVESQHAPLVRFARWPDGHRSALAVTGDVDALTIWDYALRFVGR
jgi:polysaccharide deacetylase